MKKILRALIESQRWLSKKFDQCLPESYRVDGNDDFRDKMVFRHLADDIVIYDVGGGKQPFLNLDQKKEMRAKIIGLDISQEELERAPEGIYDATLVADIANYKGQGDGDIIICQAVLEHVHDVEAAFQSINSLLKKGGKALIFVPSGNAVYAKLNMLLPEKLKKAILFAIFPHTQKAQGFKAYYDHCTPKDFRRFAKKYGFEVEEMNCFFISSYFSFFFPFYLIWRLWILFFRFVAKEQAAETFSVVLKKM